MAVLLKTTLQERSVARILFVLHRKAATAILRIADDKKQPWALYLREGVPVDADLPAPTETLGRVLFEMGLITGEAYNGSLAALAKGGVLHGEILRQMGVLDEAGLQKGLIAQLKRKFSRAMALDKGSLEVQVEDHDRGLREDSPRIDPRFVIHHGVRNGYTMERLARDLAVLDGKGAKLVAGEEALASYGFLPDDRPVLELLGAAYFTVEDLKVAAGRQAASAMMIFYTLLVTEALDVKTAAEIARLMPPRPTLSVPKAVAAPKAAPGPPRTAAPAPQSKPAAKPAAPAAKPTPQAEAARQKILAKAAVVVKQNHFEVLEIGRDTTVDDARKAYFALAKVFHPDRVIAQGLDDLLGEAATVLSRVNEAFAVLSDPPRRNQYVEELIGGVTEESRTADDEKAQKILSAEFSFEKAEVMLKRRDFAGAREEAERALQLNPDEGAYRALAAWARYATAPESAQQGMLAKIKHELTSAVQKEPKYANGHFWLAQICKAAGDEEGAQRAFQQTVKLDPRNLDAEREVRLYTMRKQKDGDKKGLFDKLRGR